MSYTLSEIDERLLLNSFNAYAGQNGTLKVDQLRNVLISLKKPYPHEYIDLLLEEQGLNYETHFTFDQFKSLCICRAVDRPVRKKLIQAFQAFDYQRRGLVDIDDVAGALTGLGEPLSIAEADMFRGLLENGRNREVRYSLLADLLMAYVAVMDRRKEVRQQKENEERKKREIFEMKQQFEEEVRIAHEEEHNRMMRLAEERRKKIEEELMRTTYEGLEYQNKRDLEKSYQIMQQQESNPVAESRRESPGRYNYIDGDPNGYNKYAEDDDYYDEGQLPPEEQRIPTPPQRSNYSPYGTGRSLSTSQPPEMLSLFDRNMIPRPVIVHDTEIQTEDTDL